MTNRSLRDLAACVGLLRYTDNVACDCLYLGAGPSGAGGAVASVFGRVGAIVGLLGDYDSALIGDVSNFGGPTVQDSLNAAKLAVDAAQTDATQALADAAAAQATANAPPVNAATGTLAILHGGTGEPTASAAFAALAPTPGAAGRVIRSDGAEWQSAVLAVTDVSGAAPSNSPTFTGTVDADSATVVLVPTVAFPDSSTNAASTAYVTAAFANGAVPLDYHVATRFTTASSSAPGFVTYLTLNFTAIGGSYYVALNGALTGSSSTTQIRSNLVIDTVSQGGSYLETGIAGGVFVLGSPTGFSFAAGAHTIDLAFEHAGGPGTTTALFAIIQVWKVA